MSLKPFALALICLALVAALPASASASSGQLAIFQDDAQLLESGSSVESNTLNELQGLGGDAVKAHVQWSHVAPSGKRKPPGFDGANPAADDWGAPDPPGPDAPRHGLHGVPALIGPAPGWATPKRGDSSGAARPSGKEYAKFAEAAGRHFGSVHIWVFWNEPNHPRFLFPQSK